MKKRPVDYFKMFYADTATFGSDAATDCGLAFFGVDKCLFASDCPFDPEGGPMYIRETIRILDNIRGDGCRTGRALSRQREEAVEAPTEELARTPPGFPILTGLFADPVRRRRADRGPRSPSARRLPSPRPRLARWFLLRGRRRAAGRHQLPHISARCWSSYRCFISPASASACRAASARSRSPSGGLPRSRPIASTTRSPISPSG